MTKAECGALGGKATVARYGPEYMAQIGKRGAATLWKRYNLRPYQLSKYALVDRQSGEIRAVR